MARPNLDDRDEAYRQVHTAIANGLLNAPVKKVLFFAASLAMQSTSRGLADAAYEAGLDVIIDFLEKTQPETTDSGEAKP